MTIKIIHTADWHLGHLLHGFDREHEHQAFLNWLFALLKKEEADALLVAGDIFDTANPSATAWQMLYQFLAKLSQEMPTLNVIILGGNHDSPSKLNAPHELLKAFNLHMLGSVSRDSQGQLDLSALIVPIQNKLNKTEAWVMAVPFLRSSDLRLQDIATSQDKLITGVEQLYQEVFLAAKQKQQEGQSLIAMGHLYMTSTRLSEMSERKILGGNQHALPASIFDKDIDYVALGHLHLAQKVGKQNKIQYSGSPIPLSMSERHYQHQVLIVELENGQLKQVEPKLVPRVVDIIRQPETAMPLKETLEVLKNWQVEKREKHLQPLVEVPVLLDEPEPLLREKILKVLENKPIRLARIDRKNTNTEKQQQFTARRLDEVSPLDVFKYSWQLKYADVLPDNIITAFDQLLELELEKGEKA